MINVNVKVPKNLTLGSEIIAREIVPAMRDSTILIESEAKNNVGYVTGTAARSITSAVAPLGGGVKGIVSVGVKYGRYLEEGTGIYGPLKQPIKPKNAQALRWKGAGGEYIFAKSVKGMRPKRFMRRAYLSSKVRVEQRFRDAVSTALKEMGK